MWKRSVPAIVPQDREVLAYLAGIIDGEGWVGINVHQTRLGNTGSIALTIANTNPKLVLWLYEQLGGGIDNMRRANPHHKDWYNWRVHGPNAAALLQAVRPFLLLKSEQADTALAFHSLRTQKGVRTAREGTRHLRDELSTNIRILNRKGA